MEIVDGKMVCTCCGKTETLSEIRIILAGDRQFTPDTRTPAEKWDDFFKAVKKERYRSNWVAMVKVLEDVVQIYGKEKFLHGGKLSAPKLTSKVLKYLKKPTEEGEDRWVMEYYQQEGTEHPAGDTFKKVARVWVNAGCPTYDTAPEEFTL